MPSSCGFLDLFSAVDSGSSISFLFLVVSEEDDDELDELLEEASKDDSELVSPTSLSGELPPSLILWRTGLRAGAVACDNKDDRLELLLLEDDEERDGHAPPKRLLGTRDKESARVELLLELKELGGVELRLGKLNGELELLQEDEGKLGQHNNGRCLKVLI